MEYNNDFRYDLLVGQGAENFLGKLLADKKLEVKLDKIAPKTGNVFVEFYSRGKPSGLATTEADYWCFVIEGVGAFIISTERLKAIARTCLAEGREKRGGDNNTSRGVLIPTRKLIES